MFSAAISITASTKSAACGSSATTSVSNSTGPSGEVSAVGSLSKFTISSILASWAGVISDSGTANSVPNSFDNLSLAFSVSGAGSVPVPASVLPVPRPASPTDPATGVTGSTVF